MCEFLRNGERWSYILEEYRRCRAVCNMSNPAIPVLVGFMKECEDAAFYEFVFTNCTCAACNPVPADQTSDGFITITIVVDW